MRTFEYRVTGAIGEDELNRLGAEGWELVSSAPARSVLKRLKGDEPASHMNAPGSTAKKTGVREKINT